MSAAKSGEEVIQRVLVGEIGGLQLQRPADPVGVIQIVGSHRDVQNIPGCDARRIGIGVVRARRRNFESGGPVIGTGAGRDGTAERRVHAAAMEPDGICPVECCDSLSRLGPEHSGAGRFRVPPHES